MIFFPALGTAGIIVWFHTGEGEGKTSLSVCVWFVTRDFVVFLSAVATRGNGQ